jgi:predicted ATPase
VINAQELARPLKSPICTAMMDFFSAIIHNLRREPEQAMILAKRSLSLSRDKGFEYFQAGSLVQLGWAMSLTSCVDEGIQLVREGVKLSESIGGKLEHHFYLFALGECLAKTSHANEAMAVVEEGIELARRAASQFHEPELLCLKAELLARRPVPNFEEAEACVREALQMTRETGAKSLELRAAVSLCRLHRKCGRTEERESLAAVAGLFTEGFDTKDFKEAMALL